MLKINVNVPTLEDVPASAVMLDAGGQIIPIGEDWPMTVCGQSGLTVMAVAMVEGVDIKVVGPAGEQHKSVFSFTRWNGEKARLAVTHIWDGLKFAEVKNA